MEKFSIHPGCDIQIQELVNYAGLQFCCIIGAMKKSGKGLEKQQEWMEDCIRKELVCNDLIYHF
jgi:hypothetical protein